MSASLWFSQMYFAHVLRASARLRADLEDWLQHSLVTAIRTFVIKGSNYHMVHCRAQAQPAKWNVTILLVF